MQEIKIIGSGVAGLCVAKELSDKGLKVLVIDKTDSPGPQSCSWWAGGMLAPWCEGESTENIVVKLGKESIPWWSKNVDGVIKKGSLVIALSIPAVALAAPVSLKTCAPWRQQAYSRRCRPSTNKRCGCFVKYLCALS